MQMTPQRRYQLRAIEAGLCMVCGRRPLGRCETRCDECQDRRLAQGRKLAGKPEAPDPTVQHCGACGQRGHNRRGCREVM